MGSINNYTWGIIKKDEENCESDMEYSSSSAADESTDDTSSSSSSSSDHSNSCGGGPLFHLAELMSQLPIKRGLSKYYHGKSQTFGSLASVESVDDLGKKDPQTTSYSRRMKSSSSCKSSGGYGGNLLNNNHRRKLLFCPKATIAKRSAATTPKTPFSPSLSAKPASTLMLVS
ncbi:hypothetical protein ABFS82_11G055000 [Erythranthe guttata]|uniref:Oxidative stress 3 n=1 Tax=Erythranthe guttata TaxID=4155 RepID=A0A022QVZ1_ERYGU|nr:PREDICTED: uncharacterized protein LOC105965435 [Erythranthe guttata]EYU30695.1 hypothetical protein MIMGU_mgv1a014972mg [Erythranthe guttata]|eukprot:XP_012845431.1 PREDICTED: uncharacterized protein LOC105965435 [Erythranthe guttata]